MRKLVFAWVMVLFCASSVYPLSLQSTAQVNDRIEDRIELGREGGTTRVAGVNSISSMSMLSMTVTEPARVEAVMMEDAIAISVENYRGGAWIEIIGTGGSKQSYFEVFDMGFDVIHLSGLRAGTYSIRITLGSEIFTGSFNKGRYGSKKY